MARVAHADLRRMGNSLPPPGFTDQTPREAPASPTAPPGPPKPQSDRTKLVAGSVVVAVLAGLAFLLFGSAGSQLTSPIAQAATVSSSTPGYRLHMAMELTAPGLTDPVTASGSGVVDLRDHASSLSLAMNFGNEPQVVQQLGSSTMRMDVVIRGTTVYAKLPPAVTAALPMSGGPWVKIDLGKLAGLPGLSSFGSDPTTTDPSAMLRSLESVSDSVVNMGTQRVDGFQTTHYRAEVDVSHLFDGVPSADSATVKQALSLFQKALPGGALPVDVWIDGNHLVRRVQTNLDLDLSTDASVQESTTIDIGDYGPQPEPAAPPAGKVVDLTGAV